MANRVGSAATLLLVCGIAVTSATARDVAHAQAALSSKDVLYARGRFVRSPDDGSVFRALRLYLRALPPRA